MFVFRRTNGKVICYIVTEKSVAADFHGICFAVTDFKLKCITNLKNANIQSVKFGYAF